MSKRVLICFVATIVVLPIVAHGTPIQLGRAQFTAEIAGLNKIVEDFEAFSVGLYPSPLVLANATYQSVYPIIADGRFGPTNELGSYFLDYVIGREFSGFAPGTSYFGVDLYSVRDRDLLRITVTGGSGTLILFQEFSSLNHFFGVADPLGLTSVTFLDRGYEMGWGNYSFDNLTTAAVPDPSSLLLLGTGLGVIGLAAWRRRK